MRTIGCGALLLGLLATLTSAAGAQEYALDTAHQSVTFKISHLGLSWCYGRFNNADGGFTVSDSPGQGKFALTIKADSVDTGNPKRDEHLKAPDFLNVKQFPVITFTSTSVKPAKDGLEVTGDFTMHGVTQPITMLLKGGRVAEFPPGVKRTGYSTELALKRSEYGMDKMLEGIGDEVRIAISFEGVQKK